MIRNPLRAKLAGQQGRANQSPCMKVLLGIIDINSSKLGSVYIHLLA